MSSRWRILLGGFLGCLMLVGSGAAVSIGIANQAEANIEAAKSKSYQLEGCRQNSVVYVLLRTRPRLVAALAEQGLLPRDAVEEANATNDLLPLKNCMASLEQGHNVLLNGTQTSLVTENVLEHRRLPIFDLNGNVKGYLPLPLGVTPETQNK